jgi:hypothetical protein
MSRIDGLRRPAVFALDLAAALRPRSPRRAVLVLGMHRSGTSAVTGLLGLLGVNVGQEDDLMSGDVFNAKGYWESSLLTDFQELLLQRFGGTWDSPPDLVAGWERDPRLIRERGRARRIVERLYGSSENWAWKDPRTCLTLPFWRVALPLEPSVIVIHRHPLEVARSLEARDGFALDHGVRLWQLYNEALLENADGLPALVLSYSDLLAEPVAVAERLARFLASRSLDVVPLQPSDLDSFVDSGLRHSHFDDDDLSQPELDDASRALARRLRALDGTHDSLSV